MDQEDERRKQVIDDYTKGFINGYAMGKNVIPSDDYFVKWVIPHTLKAEALEQMCHLHRELS